jgi:phenylacetate-CoA ligase
VYSTVYRLLRALRTNEAQTRHHLRQLEHLQWLSHAELEEWQLGKLQSLIAYAYEHVPFYRERFKQHGINPQDIQSLKDFSAIPYLTKEDINANIEDLISPEIKQVYWNETGGSTGQPMRFLVEDSFWRWNVAHEFRGRHWFGVHEGDKVAWVWGALRDMPDWHWRSRLKAKVMRHRYLNAFGMTEGNMHSFAQMLVKWKPKMIRAYSSALELFARFIKDEAITGIQPKLIETTAETVTRPQRQLFEEVFQCPVVDCYSAREFATIAYQCPMGGRHVCETRHLELVADGEAVSPGELGEVVITSMHQFAMPFIRYKIGDMGIYEDGHCLCGRGLPVLREIVGRLHDYLVTSDGQFVHGEFFAYIFRPKPQVVRYQVYQPDRHHLDVRLLCRQHMSDTWLEEVREQIQDRFGPSTQINVRIVDNLELTPAGKHRFIISKVRPQLG